MKLNQKKITSKGEKVKVTKIELPIFWRNEIKEWYGMVNDLREAWRVDNPATAGNGNITYYQVEIL